MGMSRHCCCCLDVSTGAKIIGALSVLSLTQEFTDFVPLRAVSNLAIAVVFILMLINDTSARRMAFFYIYLLGSFCSYCLSIQLSYENIQVEKPWKLACEDMKKRGDLENIGAENIAECNKIMHSVINNMLTVTFICFFLLLIHFYCVVYTHWKSFDRAKDHLHKPPKAS